MAFYIYFGDGAYLEDGADSEETFKITNRIEKAASFESVEEAYEAQVKLKCTFARITGA